MISCVNTHYFNSGMKAGVFNFCFFFCFEKKILVYLHYKISLATI